MFHWYTIKYLNRQYQFTTNSQPNQVLAIFALRLAAVDMEVKQNVAPTIAQLGKCVRPASWPPNAFECLSIKGAPDRGKIYFAWTGEPLTEEEEEDTVSSELKAAEAAAKKRVAASNAAADKKKATAEAKKKAAAEAKKKAAADKKKAASEGAQA